MKTLASLFRIFGLLITLFGVFTGGNLLAILVGAVLIVGGYQIDHINPDKSA